MHHHRKGWGRKVWWPQTAPLPLQEQQQQQLLVGFS
jgi:hypothetical protein